MGGIGMGLTKVAIILFAFHLTGGAANPARWFGPAVWEVSLPHPTWPLRDHTVYWVGPILGALAAGIFYSAVLAPEEKK
jgi:glycerol uptake facilitator-like aquaporin